MKKITISLADGLKYKIREKDDGIEIIIEFKKGTSIPKKIGLGALMGPKTGVKISKKAFATSAVKKSGKFAKPGGTGGTGPRRK